jgi:hypothetical protein
MKTSLHAFGPAALAAAVLVGSLASCGSNTNHTGSGGSGGSGGGKTTSTSSTSSQGGGGSPPVIHTDFKDPVLDSGAPADSPTLFGGVDQMGAGPCLFEPELGTLFPRNWLRPRFRFTAANGENLFEIKLDVPNEQYPLVIYTTQPLFTLPKDTWDILTTVAVGAKIHVRVRSAVLANGALTAGPFLGSEGDFSIAPVTASGTIVYWTTSNGTVLKGFAVGDETVQDVITPAQAGTQCVACHSSTPDGQFVATTASSNPGDGTPSEIRIVSLDGKAAPPSFLSPSASQLLARVPQYAPAFSKAHWSAGDEIMLSMIPLNGRTEITWTDLEATSTNQGEGWGILARNGDDHAASGAQFSHDGKTIVYTSATSSGAGVISNDGALFTVPWNAKQGGSAAPVTGAADPAYHHYYPIFSPDDALIAFNRINAGESSYNNANAEVFVIPQAGGTAVRIAANDPPACLGVTSPGVTNSWPKWAPEVNDANGRSYYFLVFSSTRNAASNGPQLYVAPIVVEGGVITTYPALYLWNQPEAEHNHTPAWDVFQLKPPN